uniref:Uncharacterized protein n=1 Tax=Arundo donax TaxID=35708 RepID=A0A0A9BYY5_ARUDO
MSSSISLYAPRSSSSGSCACPLRSTPLASIQPPSSPLASSPPLGEEGDHLDAKGACGGEGVEGEVDSGGTPVKTTMSSGPPMLGCGRGRPEKALPNTPRRGGEGGGAPRTACAAAAPPCAAAGTRQGGGE